MSSTSPRILLVQARDDDFMRTHELECFTRATRLTPDDFHIVDAPTEPLPASLLDTCDAVIVGGSGEYSVAATAPFLAPMEELMREATSRNKPTLGVCFGFHVLARAFGGRVETIETCAETGTFRIERTAEAVTDPLFQSLPDAFFGHQGHNDSVMNLPEPLVPLASSARSKHQACVARGTSVYGIQFHPELRLQDLKDRLKRYGYLDKPERQALVKDNLHETPDTDNLIRRFLEIFVLQKSAI